MKKYLIVFFCFLYTIGFSQDNTNTHQDSSADVIQLIKDSTLADNEEDYISSQGEIESTTNVNFLTENLYWLLGILLALLTGILIGKFVFKTHTKSDENSEASIMSTDKSEPILPNSSSASFYELKQQLKLVTDFDQVYFNELNVKLLDPLWQAIEQNDKKSFTEFAIQLVSHISSLARYKRGIDQKFDVYNLHYISGKPSKLQKDLRYITSASFHDDIPNQLQAIIKFLRSENSKGLDMTSINGYILKEI
jgi:hypothetical protein